jgi:para-nitrobenzyl esterase
MTISSRRTFVKQAALLLAAVEARPWLRLEAAAGDSVTATTSAGTVRGIVDAGINVFKGIPYGDTTAGTNRFMPPKPPAAWKGIRDALAYGSTAPQTVGAADVRGRAARARLPEESEDCLVLNVFTPALSGGRNRPVMVWLHGGGFSSGSGSTPILDGTSLARSGDVVVVTINHRLNVFGFTYLGEAAGSDFALSGGVGQLDIVAALQWVRDNIDRFGGDPNLVTIFGQSGGGRKVATLMAMPAAKGLFHRAIIESGAVLRLTEREDAIRATDLLLAEVGLGRGRARELQNVPMDRLLAANAAVNAKLPGREPGMTANSPTVDGSAIPNHPWDPAAPGLSASIPLLIGYARTE